MKYYQAKLPDGIMPMPMIIDGVVLHGLSTVGEDNSFWLRCAVLGNSPNGASYGRIGCLMVPVCWAESKYCNSLVQGRFHFGSQPCRVSLQASRAQEGPPLTPRVPGL